MVNDSPLLTIDSSMPVSFFRDFLLEGTSNLLNLNAWRYDRPRSVVPLALFVMVKEAEHGDLRCLLAWLRHPLVGLPLRGHCERSDDRG